MIWEGCILFQNIFSFLTHSCFGGISKINEYTDNWVEDTFKKMLSLSVAQHMIGFCRNVFHEQHFTEIQQNQLYSKLLEAKSPWTVIILETKWPSTFLHPVFVSLFWFCTLLLSILSEVLKGFRNCWYPVVYSLVKSEGFTTLPDHSTYQKTLKLLQNRAPDARQMTLLSHHSAHIC